MFENELIKNSCFFDKLENISTMDCNGSASDFMYYLDSLISEIYDNEIAVCSNCGYIFSLDLEGDCIDGDFYCDDCLPTNTLISDYHCYTIKDHTTTDRTFGIELEVEFLSESDRIRCAEEVQENGLNELFIMSYDGSLSYGIEFITHVWDLKNISSFKRALIELTEIIKNNGGFCHDSSRSGLHIHIGKTCIDYLENLRNWVYDRPSMFASLSGRVPALGTFEYARPFDNGRYSFLNETDKTLEFRLWNSTLNPNTIIERIMFTFFLIMIFNDRYGCISEREFYFFLKEYSFCPVMDSDLSVDFYGFVKKWLGKRIDNILDYI